MATITVSWGPFLKLGERWTPSRINQIFEAATFILEGAISTAQKPPGGIGGDWMSPTFISGLPDETLDPQGVDYALIHDSSLGKPTKITLTNLMSLGFGGAGAVTTLTESDEFNVLVGGTARKISVPNMRKEVHDAPNALVYAPGLATGVDLMLDQVSVLDASATEAKRIAPADLVRSVTDRVVTTTGTGTNFQVTSGFGFNVPATGLVTGLRLIVRLHQAPNAGATLQVDGLASKLLRTADDGAIVAGTLAASRIVELLYDSTAVGGTGGWLVQGLLAKAPAAWVVFNQQLIPVSGTSNQTNKNLATGAGQQDVTCVAHGLATGRVMTLNYALAPALEDTPYYVFAAGVDTLRLCKSKADAVAGVGIVFTSSRSDLIGKVFTVDPILAQEGVDSVIWRGGAYGDWFVDLATDRPNANYPVLVSGAHVDSSDPDYMILKLVTAAGPSLLGAENRLSPRVTVHCP